MDDSAIICDEIIDADDEAKSNNEETKTNFNKKKVTCKAQISILYLHFY